MREAWIGLKRTPDGRNNHYAPEPSKIALARMKVIPPGGDKRDVMLVDFSQYVVGLRSEMRFDQSIHVGFSTDEILARLIERHDGQPLWNSALTLADGTTQVSPFICLAAR